MSATDPFALLLDNDDATQAIGPGPDGHDAWTDQDRLLTGPELLMAATRDLALALDLPSVAAIAQLTARRLTGADRSTFAVPEAGMCHYLQVDQPGEPVDAPNDALSDGARIPAARTDPEAAGPPLGLRFRLGDCLSGWTIQQRQAAVVDDFGTDPRVPLGFPDAAAMHSAIVVPIRPVDPIGALGIYWTRPHEPDPSTVRLLQALAESVAVTLDNLQVRRRLEDRAGALTEELAALLYAVSHDLRAPIRHLEGFARILLLDVEDLAPDTRHSAQRIQDAAHHLQEMVNGTLTLSRIGQVDARPRPMDLAEMGREVAQSLAAAALTGPERAGVVEFVVPPSLPVTADPRLLLTVLQELLGNAWKFTARHPQPRVELGIAPPEAATGPVYFVRDNGVGFAPNGADRLFVAFQRLHNSDDFPGTGMGLAVVKRIVDKHGGTVHATSSPDSGATICFTLPTSADQAGSD